MPHKSINKILWFVPLFLLTVFAAHGQSDYTIDGFCKTKLSIPPATNEIILSPGNSVLAQAASDEKITSGKVVLRRRFSSGDYCIYKGSFALGAFSEDAGLYTFPLPPSLTKSAALSMKYYEGKETNPDKDLPNVYFDEQHIYLQKFSTVYFMDGGEWRKIKGEMKRPSGMVSVTSVPDKAKIFIDDEEKGITNGYIKDLFTGEHVVRVELPDYLPQEQKVDIMEDTVVTVSFNLLSALGVLTINSTPSHARVIVHGQAMGFTPLTMAKLKPGLYPIRFEMDMYLPESTEVSVKPHDTARIVKPLTPDFGSLHLTCVPESAHVLINDADFGTSPVDKDQWRPGTIKLKAVLDMYQERDTTVVLRRGDNISWHAVLSKDFGSLHLTSVPEHARIYINEVDNGEEPVEKDRWVPGPLHLKAVLDMYKEKDTVLNLRRGGQVSWCARLAPDFGTVKLPEIPENLSFKIDAGSIAGTTQLRRGTHRITVDGGGKFESLDTVLSIDANQNVLFHWTPRRLIGGIRVFPTPQDAEVSIDGKSLGAGAQILKNIPTGEHTVSAAKNGYQLTKTTITLSSGEMRDVSLSLAQIPDRDGDGVPDSIDECPDDPGKPEYAGCAGDRYENYHIESIPSGALVSENHREKGFTPLRISLRAGIHLLSLSKSGCVDTGFRISVPLTSEVSEELLTFIKLQFTTVFLDSVKTAGAKAHKSFMRNIRISFGALGAGCAAAGYYFEKQRAGSYNDYLASDDQDIINQKWNEAEANRQKRNMLYIASGILGSLFVISFGF